MRFLIIFLLFISAGHALANQSEISDKALIVGSELDFLPFALGNTAKTASGFTVELWKTVAAESHINYSLVVKPFNQLLKEFKNGQIDILINLAQSAERHQFADFTVPTAIVNGAIFVREEETAIHSEADLSGKSIIVINGDLAHDYAIAKGWQKQLVLTQNAADGLKSLAEGKCDAMLLSKLVGLQTLASLKIDTVKPVANAGYAQKFSFAVHKGKADLLASINEGLDITKANGSYDKIYDKWFGVYEDKQLIDRILLHFIVPFFVALAVFFGYFYFKWRALQQISQHHKEIYQQRIELALEGGDLGLWDWEIPSGKLFVNERWKEMLGLHPDDIISHIRDWEHRVHPDDWQYMNPVLEGYLQGTIPNFESEYRLLHTDGRWIWVTDRGKVVERSPDGEPFRMVGTHLDVSERKEKQSTLEALLTEQNAMLENEVIGIAKIRNSRFIWTSPTFEKIMGYDRNELIGLPTSHLFINSNAYNKFAIDCQSILNQDKPYRTEVIQVCKNGKQIWADLSCNKLDPKNEDVMGVLVDVTEQKLAEDAKQEALNRINKIACHVPGFVYQYCLRPDGSSYFPYASEQIQTVYRVTAEEVREDASKVFEIIHPDDFQGLVDSIFASAKNLTPWQYEYRIRFDDGTIRWIFGNALPTEQKDGSILWHGFINDTTDRKKTESLLQETEARNALILACAELGTWDWNIKTGHVVFNDHWARMRGYRLDEIKQHVSEWEKGIHQDDNSKIKSLLSKHFEARSGYFHCEYRVLTKSGHWIWILDRGAVIEHDVDGNPVRMAGTEMDITTRKEAENELLASRERLYLALQGANDGLWDWNFETDAVYYSPRWKSMLGYDDSELKNELATWANLVDPKDRDIVYRNAHDYAEGKISKFEVEFKMRHKNGHWVDILSRAKLAVDADGKTLSPFRLIGTHVDISERKHQELQRLAQEMAHRNILVREVHHRIKNNIQGITGILRQFAEAHPETFDPINQAISQMKSLAIVYGLQGQDTKSGVQFSDLVVFISRGIESIWRVSISVNPIPAHLICTIAENEAVPLALVMNELILNAVKHSGHPEQVNVILKADLSNNMIKLIINNTGQLPPGFDFNDRRNFNTGLDLVTSLLPRSSVKLSIEQQGPIVVTILNCLPPVIHLEVQPSHES